MASNVVPLAVTGSHPHGTMSTQGMKPRERELHHEFVQLARLIRSTNQWDQFEAALRRLFVASSRNRQGSDTPGP